MNIKNIDSYKLIDAVSKRPALYDKEDQMYYCHNKFKQRLWKETCEEVFPNWDVMTSHKRTEYGRELQKRWKNLRTCFTREIAYQRRDNKDRKEGRPVKRRKRYEYFNRMMFLLNDEQKTKIKDIVINNNDHTDHHSVASEDQCKELKTEFIEEDFEDDEDENILLLQPEEPLKLTGNNTIKDDDDVRISLNDSDDDKLFLMSLLKTFKQFDDRQKFEAKIQILSTLKRIQFPDD